MKPVADEKPAAFEDILAAEYQALRPDAGFESGDEKDLIARMHRDPQPLTALCISGGGIRSATFALGVIQGLAERGLLPRFDYLSTVSGGGYIGGWLTAWSHRAGGIGSVAPRLCRDAPRAAGGRPRSPSTTFANTTATCRRGRGCSRTTCGPSSPSSSRNILLNWTVLIPLLMAVLMVPRLYLATLSFPERLYPQILAVSQPDWANPAARRHQRIGSVWPVLPALSAVLLATALFFTLLYLPSVGGRRPLALRVLAAGARAPRRGGADLPGVRLALSTSARTTWSKANCLVVRGVDPCSVRRGLAAVPRRASWQPARAAAHVRRARSRSRSWRWPPAPASRSGSSPTSCCGTRRIPPSR